MPGKTGVKLIPRLSISKKYHSVREFVFAILDKTPTIKKEEMEALVKKEYPKSNFFSEDGKGGHFTWYKHKWNKMKLEKEFTLTTPKHEANNATISNESQTNKVRGVEGVAGSPNTKVGSRKKNRRIPVHETKRKVVVKTRKKVLQRQRHPKRTRQVPKAK